MIVEKVRQHFEKEREQGGPIKISCVVERTVIATCTGLAVRTVFQIIFTRRQHSLTCLKDFQFTRFPIEWERLSKGIKFSHQIHLHCTCHYLPEYSDMDECDSCKCWFHQHCMDLPNEVFNDSEKECAW